MWSAVLIGTDWIWVESRAPEHVWHASGWNTLTFLPALVIALVALVFTLVSPLLSPSRISPISQKPLHLSAEVSTMLKILKKNPKHCTNLWQVLLCWLAQFTCFSVDEGWNLRFDNFTSYPLWKEWSEATSIENPQSIPQKPLHLSTEVSTIFVIFCNYPQSA